MAFGGLLFHVYISCVVVVEGRTLFMCLPSVLEFFHQSLRLEYCFVRYRLADEQEDESLAPVVLPQQPQQCSAGATVAGPPSLMFLPAHACHAHRVHYLS